MAFDYDLSPFLPFRDREVCKRVRAIKKADIARHANPDFKIRVIEDEHGSCLVFALEPGTDLLVSPAVRIIPHGWTGRELPRPLEGRHGL